MGTSLKTELADVYHNEENSSVKYVALYREAQNPHGALMQVIFQLKEGDSYQPQLNVVGLVDDSDEVKDIPFSVSYQQADGSWAEEQDTTGVRAEKSVVAEALENYGSKEDQQETSEDGTSQNSAIDGGGMEQGKCRYSRRRVVLGKRQCYRGCRDIGKRETGWQNAMGSNWNRCFCCGNSYCSWSCCIYHSQKEKIRITKMPWKITGAFCVCQMFWFESLFFLFCNSFNA